MTAARRAARTAVGLVALAAIVVLVSGTVVWQILDSRRSLRSQVLGTNRNTAEVAGIAVATDIKARLQILDQAVRVPAVVDLVQRRDSAVGVLLSAVRSGGGFASAALVSPDGTVVASEPASALRAGSHFSDRLTLETALASNRAELTSAFAISPSEIGVNLTSAVRGPDSTPIGVIVAVVSSHHLEQLTSQLRLPTDGSLRIFDALGHPLWRGADPSRSYGADPIVRAALGGESGGAEGHVLGLSGTRLAAYASIKGLGWAVVVDQPKAAAYGPVAALTVRLSLIGGLVALGALCAALLVSRLLRHLARERNQSNAILASVADGAVISGPEGVIMAVNPAMESMLGWSESELRGKRYGDVFRQCDRHGVPVPDEAILDQAIANRAGLASRGYDVNLVHRNGELVPVSVTAAPVLDGRGELLGGVAIIRDVSFEREVDQMKSSLVSTVSHELRTPLTMIQGFSELLLARDVSEERRREALEHINTSAERLGRLIEDVLSVSRIESGRLIPQVEAIAVGPLFDEVVVPLDGDRRIRIDVPDGTRVFADRDMVVQIVTNLVSNALKYSPADSAIEIAVEPHGESFAFTVRDHGLGMTDDDLARLFEKFFRADRPEVRDAGGTGLGLYITRSLVELQGGVIEVTSAPGVGSEFTFTLPAVRQPVGATA